MRGQLSRSSLFAALLALLPTAAIRAQVPSDLPTSLPVPTGQEQSLPITDLTPPELAAPFKPVDAACPPPDRAGGIFGFAEFLLMTPHQGGMSYAIVDPKNDLVPQGPVQSVNYDDRVGLRVGLGYQFARSGWDIDFTYTGFNEKISQTAIAPAGGLLYLELTRPGLTDSASAAIATARLEYNIFDLAFSRTFDLEDSVQVRLSTGVRFASIHQNLNALYNGMLADFAYTDSQSNFTGAGPMFGGELRWRFGHGLSLFGGANCGLVYGNIRARQFETNDGGGTLYADLTDVNRQVIPFAGIALGMAWEYRGLTIRAGYEAVNWFGLIERLTLSNDFAEGKLIPQQTDLSIDGFFLKLMYSF